LKPSKKNDLISMVFLLVFGAFFAVLGVFFFGIGAYSGGLMLILMAVSYTKYKTYTKYYVPTLLTCGIILTIIGINLAYTMHNHFIYATGQGVLGGGILNLIVARARKTTTEKLTIKKIITIVFLVSLGCVQACIVYFGIFLFSLLFIGSGLISLIFSLWPFVLLLLVGVYLLGRKGRNGN
jgi:drug/metabolite transporter (DMT)-like permease